MDNIDRLLDAIEHPDRYSEEELDALMKEPEAREIYDLISKSKDCVYVPALPDVDAEWHEFTKSERINRFSPGTFIRRNGAAVIIGIIATLAAVAAGISLSVSHSMKSVEKTVMTSKGAKEIRQTADDMASGEEIHAAGAETIVFKEETLARILGDIARYYGANLEFKNEESKGLRLHMKWDQCKTLEETIELLNNFEQINITLIGNNITVE